MMPRKRLLILSSSDDVHALQVASHLEEDDVIFWEPEWNADAEFSFRISDEFNVAAIEIKSSDSDLLLSPETIDSVWYRRPFSAMPSRNFRSLSFFVMRERDDTLDAILRSWQGYGVRVYNRSQANYYASNKPYQLLCATKAGLKVPQTTIGNSPKVAKKHIELAASSVLKGVLLSGLDDGTMHHAIFVHEIDNEAIRTIEQDLPNCPVTVQSSINWTAAVRLLICDDYHCAFLLPRTGPIDWRQNDGETFARYMELPSDVLDKTYALMGMLDISYGVIDLLIDSENQFWFLEVNPNGQWLWLEEESGLAVSKDIASILKGS